MSNEQIEVREVSQKKKSAGLWWKISVGIIGVIGVIGVIGGWQAWGFY